MFARVVAANLLPAGRAQEGRSADSLVLCAFILSVSLAWLSGETRDALFLADHHLNSLSKDWSLALIDVSKSVQALFAMMTGGSEVLPL